MEKISDQLTQFSLNDKAIQRDTQMSLDIREQRNNDELEKSLFTHQQELNYYLLQCLRQIKSIKHSSILNSPQIKSDPQVELMSDEERDFYKELHLEDIDLQSVESSINLGQLTRFEDIEYLITRLVTQRTNKLYKMFAHYQEMYLNQITTMRQNLIYQITLKVKKTLPQEIKDLIKEQQRSYSDIEIVLPENSNKKHRLSDLDFQQLLQVLYELN